MKKILCKLGSALLAFTLMCSVGISSVSAKETENKLEKQGSITISDENYDYMLRTGEAVFLGDGTWAKIESPDKMLDSNRDASASDTEWFYYIHFYKTINVSLLYTPELDIYVKCTGYERDFVSIYDLNLNRSSDGYVKQFAGKCTAKVQDADTIYWVINGDWYDNGTTTETISSSVTLGGFELGCSVSYASNWYDYTYETGYVTNRP